MRFTTAAVIAAGVIATTLPLAAAADPGFTLGANVGSARIDQGDFEGDDTSWKFHLGGSYDQIIGGELAYVNFGRYGADKSTAKAFAPAVMVGLPLGNANLYAKGGVAFADVEGSSLREEYRNEDPFYGVGLRIGMTPALGFRAEYERYQFDFADLDLAQAGLEFRFGGR